MTTAAMSWARARRRRRAIERDETIVARDEALARLAKFQLGV
jgi:hypothetical protein